VVIVAVKRVHELSEELEDKHANKWDETTETFHDHKSESEPQEAAIIGAFERREKPFHRQLGVVSKTFKHILDRRTGEWAPKKEQLQHNNPDNDENHLDLRVGQVVLFFLMTTITAMSSMVSAVVSMMAFIAEFLQTLSKVEGNVERGKYGCENCQ
jgi:hypothetical protein